MAWRQFVVVRSAQEVSLYQNGALLTNTVMNSAPDWDQMWLGRDQKGFWPLYGRMDDVRLYNRALAPDEVRQLYELEGPPFASVDKVIHLYASTLVAGTNYQLQVSTDLASWTDLAPPFTAISATTNWYSEAADAVTFWRLKMFSGPGSTDPQPQLDFGKAVTLTFYHLSVGTAYQLQYSMDQTTWTDYGPAITATQTSLVYPDYVDVSAWGSRPFFRLKPVP
jgi:hypothetical protein